MVDNNNGQWDDIEYTDNGLDNESYEDDGSYSDDYQEGSEDYNSYDDSYDDGGYDSDNADDNGYEDNYDNEERAEDGDETEKDEDEAGQGTPAKKKSPLLLIIIAIILFAVAAFIAIPKLTGNNDQIADNDSQQQEDVSGDNFQVASDEDLADSFFNEASQEDGSMTSVNFNENNNNQNMDMPGNENNNGNNMNDMNNNQMQIADNQAPAGDQNQSAQQFNQQQNPMQQNQQNQDQSGNDLFGGNQDADANNSIMVVYNKAARLNPFKPPIVEKQVKKASPFETINNTQFEIIEPPTASVPDENLTRLLQTQISGIMYDKDSPSAIVNINGQDYFVKTGDQVAGYKIGKITKDQVQINYNNNTYSASVGELFAKTDLSKQPAIPNLESKFAGRYKYKE